MTTIKSLVESYPCLSSNHVVKKVVDDIMDIAKKYGVTDLPEGACYQRRPPFCRISAEDVGDDEDIADEFNNIMDTLYELVDIRYERDDCYTSTHHVGYLPDPWQNYCADAEKVIEESMESILDSLM